jgi:hypothetical protein
MKLARFLSNKEIIPIWSNVPFYIPATIAVTKGLWAYGLLITLAASVSLFYHLTDEKEFKRVDKVLAYSVIAANLFVLYLAKFKTPYFPIALVFVGIAFYFFLTGKDHKYDVYHGMWHLCSVVITLMCVLAY